MIEAGKEEIERLRGAKSLVVIKSEREEDCAFWISTFELGMHKK